jgi:hypothetical protein
MRRSLRAVAAALALTGLAGLAAAAELTIRKYNRVYEDLAGELAPIDMPPVRILLSSPSQAVVVKENLTRLAPLGGGRFGGTVEIELLGKGQLVVDVDFGGSVQRLEDEVLLPPQRIVLEGVARIERVEGGYRVRPESLPPSVRLEVRSRLINQVLDLCGGAALLTLGALDCRLLQQALERPEVPLSGVADDLFLPDADLAADERAAFDALLAAR